MAEEIVCTAKSYGATFRAREAKRERDLRAGVVEAAHAAVAIVTQSINDKVKRDTGALIGSVHVESHRKGAAEVMVDAPHAAVIEVGARPHMPPKQPILDWVMRHLQSFQIQRVRKLKLSTNVPRNAAAVRRKDQRVATHVAAVMDFDAAVDAVVEGIRWKIFHEGSPPHWYMKSSLPKMRKALQEIVERRMRTGK